MKTITMMQLRKSPGEFSHLVSRHGETFLVTSGGKPVFKLVPVTEVTTIHTNGSVTRPKPLTFREDLGSEYAKAA